METRQEEFLDPANLNANGFSTDESGAGGFLTDSDMNGSLSERNCRLEVDQINCSNKANADIFSTDESDGSVKVTRPNGLSVDGSVSDGIAGQSQNATTLVATSDDSNGSADDPKGSADDPNGSADDPNGSADDPNGSTDEEIITLDAALELLKSERSRSKLLETEIESLRQKIKVSKTFPKAALKPFYVCERLFELIVVF